MRVTDGGFFGKYWEETRFCGVLQRVTATFSMKFVLYGLMIPIAFVLGKVLYDPLLGDNVLAGAETAETVVEIKVKSPMGTITETIDLEDVDPKDYPAKITLSSSMILTDQNGLSPLKLDPGSPVKPLLLDEMLLEVTSPLATHLTGKVSVLDTNFAEQVAIKRMDRRMAMLEMEKGGNDTPAPPPTDPTPSPKEVASVESADPEEMMEKPEPEPAPEPETPKVLTVEEIIAAMKESLQGGQISELDASKVINWESADRESFDGEEFQVGLATYREMTILGEKTLQAKALFKEGKLDKWIHAKTGMQIR